MVIDEIKLSRKTSLINGFSADGSFKPISEGNEGISGRQVFACFTKLS